MLKGPYEEYIHLSRYARYLDDKGRRETWEETIDRYFEFFSKRLDLDAPVTDSHTLGDMMYEAKNLVLKQEIMPSMRCLMTAGEALDRDNVAAYNCAYVHIDNVRAFDEIMYILLCGTGDGYSVRRRHVSKLPAVAESFHDSATTIVVSDSKIGWASAFRELVSLLYSGKVPQWDMSKVRPAGARLRTFGGRASGPKPLQDLFKYTVNTFRRFAGKQLPTIAVHDILCKVAEIVVVGGVRRSAMISLSDIDDEYMRKAKSPYDVEHYTLLGKNEDKTSYSVTIVDGPYGSRSLLLELSSWESEQLQKHNTIGWWHVHPERRLANNSVCYDKRPSVGVFMQEWLSLYESGSGERGIFNAEASQNVVARSGRRDSDYEFGTNPCSEIILRSGQFCNLSEVVIRPNDTLDRLQIKVAAATLLGTIQSTLVDFRYLRAMWKNNTEEERLLGVSLTGICDHHVLGDVNGMLWESGTGAMPMTLKEVLDHLRNIAVDANAAIAKAIGIPPSTAITCVKPSGTVSQLVNSSSGMHNRYSQYYIRRVRTDKKDPLYAFMSEQGVPVEDDVMNPSSTAVFSFPVASDAVVQDRTAIEQLELWKLYAESWCEHKPSVTINVKEHEWVEVAAWVWDNFDIISGVSFLPWDGGSYRQAPYERITKEQYDDMSRNMPVIDWSSFKESYDNTTGSQELACTGGSCELQ